MNSAVNTPTCGYKWSVHQCAEPEGHSLPHVCGRWASYKDAVCGKRKW